MRPVMRRFLPTSVAVVIVSFVLVASAQASSVGFHFHFGIAPPPIAFVAPPELVLIPGTYAYFAPYASYRTYRVRDHWYVHHGGDWYCAPSYRGPFRPVVVAAVPGVIRGLPVYHRNGHVKHGSWKHEHWKRGRGGHGHGKHDD